MPRLARRALACVAASALVAVWHVRRRRRRRGTLRQIFVVTRHGARFPMHALPGDLAWPVDPSFWDSFGGMLTPTGHHQMRRLGERFRAHYARQLALAGDGERISAFSTNCQRTVQSGTSFLEGFAPELPVYYSVLSDRVGETTTDAALESARARGVCLHIDMVSDRLLRQAKTSAAFAAWKAALPDDAALAARAAEPAARALLDRMWRLTAFKKLDPTLAPAKRAKQLTYCATQIAISDALGRGAPFLSAAGEPPLRADERALCGESSRTSGPLGDEAEALSLSLSPSLSLSLSQASSRTSCGGPSSSASTRASRRPAATRPATSCTRSRA